MSNIVKNNYINKNWFYVLDENSPSTIDVLDFVYAIIFVKDLSRPFTINLQANSKLDFYWYFYEFCSPKILFNQLYDNSVLNVKLMYFCDKNDLSSNVKSYINSNNSSSNIEILNILKDSKLTIDSLIEMEKWSKSLNWQLNQNNIFVWENAKIRWLPKLFVKTNDIKASHSCKIHKINENQIFYLTSRWISKSLAKNILLKSYFQSNFKCLQALDKTIFEDLEKSFDLSI